MAVGPRVLEGSKTDVTFKHIMAPLDGTERSEAALPIAHRIASGTGARTSLVRVVPWAVQTYPYTLPDTYLPQVDDELEKGAKSYLQRKESEHKNGEIRAYVVRGAVADGLLDFAGKEGVDLVVMSTHARSGIARAALGSTADRMIQGTAPVLLVRPEQ
jgi:nucleotide-binding universal stress UspA family protein